MVIAFVLMRAGTLLEILPAAPRGTARATDPVLDGLLMAVALAQSLAMCVVAVRRRQYPAGGWAWADVAVAMAVLLAQPWYLAPEDWVGTWTAWGGALSVNAVFGAAIGLPTRGQTAAATAAVAVAYAVPGVVLSHAHASTAASNLIGYLVFAVAARSSATFVRRLGRDADEARRQAAVLAAEAERDRHRLLLHDQITIMRLLAEPGLEPGLVEVLRRQAAAGAARVRHFLEQSDADLTGACPADGGRADGGRADGGRADGGRAEDGLPAGERPEVMLAELVRQAGEGFTDLPIDYAVDLAADVPVPPAVAGPLRAALATVLHNVRAHAAAGQVVVHADAPPGLGRWEVSVRDDGRGFDQARRPLGFGLRVQVSRALAEVGVESEIRSAPGAGTVVLLRGRPAER
ncbi:ATP-binding protein [Kitasatospora sp. NRRL B-11411]|uniref:ATP-binding protein n=1 Tax=Kitasatospora sp. NRRL B-11411 TaxID=1463822 RepID=UPI0004C39BE4|nr:ATP-binding protein [Kitasatospora sp. NRRL B-11411]